MNDESRTNNSAGPLLPDTGKGAWKAVEIDAEASVDGRERWSEALAHLYADLGRELKTL